jgi:phosphoenolpyruvate-protein phosphotransferase (PTS system enzyme I)
MHAELPRAVPVSLCGAMAQDPLGAILLVGLGLRRLSMGASAIPEITAALRRVSLSECEAAAQQALGADTAEAVESILTAQFGARLTDLICDS